MSFLFFYFNIHKSISIIKFRITPTEDDILFSPLSWNVSLFLACIIFLPCIKLKTSVPQSVAMW